MQTHTIDDFQNGKIQKEYTDRYYQEILDVISRYKDYSVLGHLNLIKRYDKKGDYPFQAGEAIITEILKKVIQAGKVITIGSDSHEKHHLGAYIEDTKLELKALGYEQYCTFEGMQPIFHEL